MLKIFLPIVFFSSTLLLGGCLVTTNGTRVVRKDEQRRPVQFESDQGLLDFNTAVRQRGSEGARRRGSSSFNVPFIISANSRHVLSWSAYFNDQVQLADVDADGQLSDAEVQAFVGTETIEEPLEPSTRDSIAP